MSQHGVLSSQGVLVLDAQNNRWITSQQAVLGTLTSLFEIAVQHKLTTLWVMPDTGIIANQGFYDAAQEQWSTVASWKFRKDFPLPPDIENELIQATGRSKQINPNSYRPVQVSVCFAHNSHWDWGREADLTPKELLRIVGYLERALEVRVGAGPSSVGTRVLEKTLAKYPHWLQVPEVNLHSLPFTTDAAKNVIWDRKPEASELKKKYLVKIDKNSAYPRACVEETFGDAHVSHVAGLHYNHRYPGVWRISVQGEDQPSLPPPLWESAKERMGRNELWVGTPIVKLLSKIGYSVQVHEGWAFVEEKVNGKLVKHYHGVLKHWAEHLWEVRKGFTNETLWKSAYAREAAQGAIKNILNMTIGVTKFDQYETLCYQARPDWNVQVVASARAAMFYNMLKFQQEGKGTPVMVYIDALLYCADEMMPFVDNRVSLGGYKHEWTLEIADDVQAILMGKRSRAKKLEHLNDLAEKQAVAKDGKLV